MIILFINNLSVYAEEYDSLLTNSSVGICKTVLKSVSILEETDETTTSVTYSYDTDTKTLTISGQGTMKDYEVDNGMKQQHLGMM